MNSLEKINADTKSLANKAKEHSDILNIGGFSDNMFTIVAEFSTPNIGLVRLKRLRYKLNVSNKIQIIAHIQELFKIKFV